MSSELKVILWVIRGIPGARRGLSSERSLRMRARLHVCLLKCAEYVPTCEMRHVFEPLRTPLPVA